MSENISEPESSERMSARVAELEAKLAEATAMQSKPRQNAGQATGKCVEAISDGLEDKRRMDILERLRDMGELSLGNNNGLFDNAKETQAVATIGPDGSRDYCASTVREVLDLVANALWGDALDRAVLAARSPKERAE